MGRLFTGITVALAQATVIGLVVLWPGDVAAPLAGGLNTTSENALLFARLRGALPLPACC